MSNKRYSVVDDEFFKYIQDNNTIEDHHETNITNIYELCDTLNQYESEKKEICKYIQRKINECENPQKLDEIGVSTDPGAAWGYCKALKQIKKGLQYRKLWVDDAE